MKDILLDQKHIKTNNLTAASHNLKNNKFIFGLDESKCKCAFYLIKQIKVIYFGHQTSIPPKSVHSPEK